MTIINFFQRLTVSNSTFNTTPDVSFNIQNPSFSLINEASSGTIQYSFDGVNVHGDLVASTVSSALAFNNRGYSVIWFKTTSATCNIRVEAIDGDLVLAGMAQSGIQNTILTPSIPSSSSVLEASHVIKASGGTFRSLFVQLDPTAPSATYYVQLLTASAVVPPDGAVTFLRPPQTVIHTNGIADYINFNEGDSGILFTVGCTACLSSTQFTKTISGAYALFSGSVV